ncbi:MAG: T9SS type A sorting domain-containing protein, partial [Chitinophagales bacterium]|nr:T9SS type A sorting domain-containing protein [Chitinophagales bacterium]
DGVITFYLSSLASNHDENTTGDWTYTLTKTLDVATSIQQVNDESVIQLYPNPAQEGIMISLNEEWKNAIITLHGVDGKKYFTFSALPDQNKILISRSEWNLNKGIYLLSIQSGENFFTKKIIFL